MVDFKGGIAQGRKWWRRLLLIAIGLPMAIFLSLAGWRAWQYAAHMRTARIALNRFVADNAVDELEAAVKLRPDSAEAHYLLGVANRKAGHIDDVRQPLNEAMRLGWPKKDVRFQLTMLAFQAGDREAEAQLKQMTLRPMDDDTAEQLYESFARGYLSEYRANDAMMVLQHWVDWRPECVLPKLLRADVYGLTNQPLEEEKEYRQVLAIDPKNYTAQMGLAHLMETQHDTKRALEHFQFCHAEWKSDPRPLAGIARCLKQEGRLDEARKVLSELVERPMLPGAIRAPVLSNLAEFAEQQRDLRRAVELLSEAVELDPYNSKWRFHLGVCLAKTGRKEEAKRATERANELDRLTQRQSDLENELLTHPDDAELRCELGEILLELGHPKASAAMMLSALRWNPRQQRAHAVLVKYYHDLGRDDLAEMHRSDMEQSGSADRDEAAAQKTSSDPHGASRIEALANGAPQTMADH